VGTPTIKAAFRAAFSLWLRTASAGVLALTRLGHGEGSGADLIPKLKAASGAKFEWNEAMLNPLLRAMEKQGLIESEWRESPSGRRRKCYRVLEAGRQFRAAKREEWMAIHRVQTGLWIR